MRTWKVCRIVLPWLWIAMLPGQTGFGGGAAARTSEPELLASIPLAACAVHPESSRSDAATVYSGRASFRSGQQGTIEWFCALPKTTRPVVKLRLHSFDSDGPADTAVVRAELFYLPLGEQPSGAPFRVLAVTSAAFGHGVDDVAVQRAGPELSPDTGTYYVRVTLLRTSPDARAEAIAVRVYASPLDSEHPASPSGAAP